MPALGDPLTRRLPVAHRHFTGCVGLAVALCLLVAPLAGTTESRPSPGDGIDLAQKSRAVDALFASYDSVYTPGCVVGVMHQGRFIHAKGYGMANLEHAIALTPRTRVRLDSMSKQFTAAAMILLSEQGKVSLDDDIRKYLPELPDYGDVITIHDLLAHRSGLPEYDQIGVQYEDWAEYYSDYEEFFRKDPWVHREVFFTRQTYLKRIASVPKLKFTPGSKFEYNNPGYFLMSQIVERASGQTLAQFAEENIFRPLGMADTLFYDRVLEPLRNNADGYLALPDGRFLVFNTNLNIVGEGGVITTLYDFLLWDENFYANRLGNPDSQLMKLMRKPGIKEGDIGYGEPAYGLSVRREDGLVVEVHGGAYVGFKTIARRYPEKHFSVAVLCNRYDADDLRDLSKRVAELYLQDL
jgi:CubicO group peptidase (beta-lactamase class C family)